MPTVLPRVNVTISEEQSDLLRRMVKLRGGSLSSHVRDMLDHATPMLRELVPLMERTEEEMERVGQQVHDRASAELEVLLGVEEEDDGQTDWVKDMRSSGREKPTPRSDRSTAG